MTSRKVLFVDDEPNVLSGFRRVLRKDYEFDTAIGGAEGLSLIQKNEYAVVVSDMRMPEMSGEEFLAKAHVAQPNAVQMILSGQANLDSTVAAVNNGHIFRFLVKPVEKQILTAALDKALHQYRLVHAEREPLQKTLSGAVAALTEVVTLVSPAASRRTSFVVTVVKHIAAQSVELNIDWQLRLAAMLSGIGFAAVPTDVLTRSTLGQQLSAEEEMMVGRHPEVTGRLLGPIPRLEGVSGIIRAQSGAEDAPNGLERQVEILDLAVTVAERLLQEHALLDIVHELEELGRYPQALIDPLRSLPLGIGGTVERKKLRQLAVGMTLRQDVRTQSGVMLAGSGMLLTESLLERIRNFALSAGVDEPIAVSVS